MSISSEHKESIDFPDTVQPWIEDKFCSLGDVQPRPQYSSGVVEVGTGPTYGAPRYALKKPIALAVTIPSVPPKGAAYQLAPSEASQTAKKANQSRWSRTTAATDKPAMKNATQSHWSRTTTATEKPTVPKASRWSATTRSSDDRRTMSGSKVPDTRWSGTTEKTETTIEKPVASHPAK
jgi:hypothetical protein